MREQLRLSQSVHYKGNGEGTYFCILCFSFKFCNNACIMTSFGKKEIHQFLLSVLKINYILHYEDKYFVQFWWLSNHNFHPNVVILIISCLGFEK